MHVSDLLTRPIHEKRFPVKPRRAGGPPAFTIRLESQVGQVVGPPEAGR